MKPRKIRAGLYMVYTEKGSYSIEDRADISPAKPLWRLVNERRDEWINDFATKREAIAAIEGIEG